MLDYSTSSIKWFSIEEGKNVPPPNDKFHLGNLEWDVNMYSKSQDLKLFRQYFRLIVKDSKVSPPLVVYLRT